MFWRVSVVIGYFFIFKTDILKAGQFVCSSQREHFQLSVIHMNDFHARFGQTSMTLNTCHKGEESTCIGGLARVMTVTRKIMREQPNTIFLNAGDNFLGTLWYNTYRWNATVHFMNKFPHDAMTYIRVEQDSLPGDRIMTVSGVVIANHSLATIGNHDFDDGIEGLIPFVKSFNSSVVVANIDDRAEPTMRGLYKNSTVIVRDNRRIGVIGVITNTTKTKTTKTGKLEFRDEVKSVTEEARKLKSQGIDIIIVLSHVGLDMDKEMAANCQDIDVIVGGHSNSLLYTGTPPNGEVPEDVYPVVITQNEINRTVLVVQTASFTKYLGNLTVWFDSRGEVANWEGNPVTLDNSVQQDAEILKELELWGGSVIALEEVVVGETENYLNRSMCLTAECNIANLITDAMVHAFTNKSQNPNYWTNAAISCVWKGSIRNGIPPGNITYGDLVTAQPFGSTWDTVELRGDDIKVDCQSFDEYSGIDNNVTICDVNEARDVSDTLKSESGSDDENFGEALEESIKLDQNSTRELSYSVHLLWSGVRVTYNLSNPSNSRIVDLKVRCQECSTPKFEELRNDSWYRIVVPSFYLSASDQTDIIRSKHRNHVPGSPDIPQLVGFIKTISPFEYETDGRLKFISN